MTDQLLNGSRLSRLGWAVLVAGLALLVGAARPAAAERAVPPLPTAAFQPAECMFEFPVFSFLRPGLLGFKCGYVLVPERHERPDGPTIRLAVAILPAQAENPAPDPLFMAQGGPGGSSLELFPLLMLTNPLRTGRDIVIFDQRGTYYSQPNLLCPELDTLLKETINLDLDKAEADRRSLAAYQACAQRLAGEGVDLAAYNSLENAADIEAIRQALGYDRINFYGVSYGTLLGQHYLRAYPNSLRSIILDAVVPAQGSYLTPVAQSADRAFKEVARVCAADPACQAAYPDVESVIYEVMAALNKEPARVPVTDPHTGQSYQAVIDGDTFVGVLFQASYEPLLLPTVPAMVYQTRAGHYDQLSSLLPVILFQPTFSLGMYQTVICAEEANFDPVDVSTEGVRPELAELMREDTATLLEVCRLWHIPPLGPEVNEPVHSTVPALLLSGRFDPITPPPFAEEVAAGLPNSYTFTFPNTSHGALTSSECALQIARSFLNNPDEPPPAGCLAAAPTTFEIPTPATVVISPVMDRVLKFLDGQDTASAGLLLLCLLGLLTPGLVWPIAWLIRRLRRQPPPARRPGPVVTWGAPLLVVLAAAVGWLFVAGLVAIVATSSISSLFVGVPRGFMPLFGLPWLLLLCALGLVVMAALVWLRRYWSAGGRLYYSLLAGLALVAVVILARWGMLAVWW